MADKEKRQMPKGGRKGGTTFPRLPLAKALEYSTKLVSKTHTGPGAPKIVLVGVFGTAGSDGLIRSSALKQYGLLESDEKGMQASRLARAIDAAPAGDKVSLVQKAFLAPKVFKGLYETFRGDTVSRAKLRQQALGLKVHPDAAEDCVEHFVASLASSALGTESDDGISILTSPQPILTKTYETDDENKPTDAPPIGDNLNADAAHQEEENQIAEQHSDGPRAVFHVNVNLDAALDTEKLERQLQLLRRYGAI
jgi:hypothetical protein